MPQRPRQPDEPVTDRRVRRTRAALIDAFLELVAERGYDGVTVQAIIEHADVGRSTFYSHFNDKEELLRAGFGDLRAIVAPATPGPTGPRTRQTGRRPLLSFSLPLLQHASQQRRLVRAVLGRQTRNPVARRIEDLLTEVVQDDLAAQPPPRTDLPPEALARVTVGAYTALLDWWLTEQPQLPPEAVDRIFTAVLGPGLRSATRPPDRQAPDHRAQ